MKKTVQIKIPNPCKANWDKMSPTINGRHCDDCNKTVVDFTKMTNDEIILYLSKPTSENTCGHFLKGQLKNDKNRLQKYFYNQYCKASLTTNNKILRIASLVIIGGLLTLTGCNTPTNGEIQENQEQLTGDTVLPVKIDSTIGNAIDTSVNQR